MGTVTRLNRPTVLRAITPDWPAVPEPRQLPATEYVTVSGKVQQYAASLAGAASRIRAKLGGSFVTRADLTRLQRDLAEASTLVEALAKEAGR